MEAHSVWYDKIAKQINLHRETLDKKEAKKYKLDLLLKVAGRVDEFFAICGECQLLQPEVKRLVDELGNLVQFPEKEARKRYNRSLSDIVKHLQKTHKLVRKGQNLGIWMAIGTGIGVAIGAALDNVGIGPGLGVGIGFAIGGYLDKKAEREGRVI